MERDVCGRILMESKIADGATTLQPIRCQCVGVMFLILSFLKML